MILVILLRTIIHLGVQSILKIRASTADAKKDMNDNNNQVSLNKFINHSKESTKKSHVIVQVPVNGPQHPLLSHDSLQEGPLLICFSPWTSSSSSFFLPLLFYGSITHHRKLRFFSTSFYLLFLLTDLVSKTRTDTQNDFYPAPQFRSPDVRA